MNCLCFWRQALFFIKCPNYLHWSRVRSFEKKAISGLRLSEWGEHQQLQRSPFEWSIQNLLWFPLVYSEQSFQSFRQFGQSSCSCYRKYNSSPFQTQLSSLQSFNRKLRAICFVIVMLEKSTLSWTTVQPDFIGQVAFRSLFLYWNVNFEALILHSKPKF